MFRLIMSILVLLVANVAMGQQPSAESEFRTWTDSTGKFQVEAKFTNYRNLEVTLELADGKALELPLKKLSRDDQLFVRSLVRQRADAAKPKSEPVDPADPMPMDNQPAARREEDKPNDRGLGILPLERPRPFVHVEGMPAPKPEACVRCRWTDPDQDAAALVEAEAIRLKTAGQRHLDLEKKLGYELVRVETHGLVVHAQLPPAEAQKVGLALEGMKIHLQQATGSMLLTPQTPAQDEMICVFGEAAYLRLLKVIEEEQPDNLGESWNLMPELAGGVVGRTSIFHQKDNSHPPAHMAVSQSGIASMSLATKGRGASWLSVGFAAYCENVVLGKVLIRYIRYENKELKIGDNWALECKRLAAAGALQPWSRQIALDLRDYELVNHVQSYAMVSYLLQRDPQKFQDMVQLFAEGKDSTEAIETAYGSKLDTLQKEWFAWLTQ
jgi:hypothetical protein